MSDVIAQLPEKAFDGISEHLLCSICYSPTDQWVMACDGQHSFCAPCLISHEEARMRADGDASCPQCRGELVKTSSDNFRPDYLKNKLTLDHRVECPQQCGESFSLDKLKKHMQEKCPNGLVPCPMASIGCEHVLKRCEIQQHLKDDNHSHLAMGFMLKMSAAHEQQMTAMKGIVEDQGKKIESQAATISNLNTALASHTTTMSTNTTAINGFKTKLDSVEKKLDTALSDGEHSLKQIAIQTKKRASPGEGTSSRAVRGRAQVERQNAELSELREKVKTAEANAPATAPAADADAAAPVAAGNAGAMEAAEGY